MTKFKKGDIARIPGYGLCIVKSGPHYGGGHERGVPWNYYKVWLLEHKRSMDIYSKSVYPVKAEVEGG